MTLLALLFLFSLVASTRLGVTLIGVVAVGVETIVYVQRTREDQRSIAAEVAAARPAEVASSDQAATAARELALKETLQKEQPGHGHHLLSALLWLLTGLFAGATFRFAYDDADSARPLALCNGGAAVAAALQLLVLWLAQVEMNQPEVALALFCLATTGFNALCLALLGRRLLEHFE